MHQPRVGFALSIAFALGAGMALAGTVPDKPHDQLPSEYSLADVSFEFSEGGAYGGMSVRIGGNGKGVVTSSSQLREDTATNFEVVPATVFDLLQLCYRGGFFDLQPSYGPPNSVRLRSDGTVETLTTVVADAAWSRITVRIGQYAKSVGYLKGHGNPPPVVAEVETRIQQARDKGRLK